jgi:esterase/lipase superfamily enzyme
MTGETIQQAIAAGWDRIAEEIGSGLREFEIEVTPLLRELDQNADDRATIDAIFALFDKYPSARERFRESLSHTGAVITKSGGEQRPLERKVRYTSVPVFFGTSRAATGESAPAHYFGADRADNSFGLLHVSIPDDHRMGKLEKPRWFKLQFREDPEKHVLLLNLEPLDQKEFVTRVRSGLVDVGRREVLVFIHGYNVTFEDAARRTAQLAYDLVFEGVPVLYSWPSEGSPTSYLVDANNVNWAQRHFRDFLRLVRKDLGADVHIIAHSMGTRLLANAIEHVTTAASAAYGRLRQIVFAAPDIDADTFRQQSDAFSNKAERITLYASSGDLALAASQQFQRYARAGQSGLDLVIIPTIDTVDASAVKTEFLGHSYFGDADSVVSDLFYLIRHGMNPRDRHLREKRRFGSAYWEFSRT